MPNETALHPDVVTAERLGDEIAELAAHIEVATARLLDLIRQFDALSGWGHAGAKSCAEWLAWRVGLNLRAAYERVRVARALPSVPLIATAFARGEISYSKVRALTRVARPETEERLLTFARSGTATHVERLARAWRRVDRNAENQEAEQQHQSRTLSVYQDEDGMYVIRGRLTPEVGAVVRQALTAATDRLYAESRLKVPGQCVPTTTQHQADALGIIAEAALHHDLDPGTSGARYQIVVHVDAAALADPDQPGQSVLDEVHCSAEQSRRIACDASRVLMKHDAEGCVVEVGANADDPAGVTQGARASRPRLSVPGLWLAVHAGAPHPALGERRPHHAVEPGRHCAGGIIARFMRTAFGSNACPMGSWNSAIRTAG